MRVVALGDLHLPWPDWKVLRGLSKWLDWYQPDAVVQVGDFIDGYSWSRFGKAPDSPSAADEWEGVKKCANRLWNLFPADLPWHILEGNHDRRIQMKACEVQLPSQLIRPIKEQLPYSNWNWHVKAAPLKVDGIAYIHGDEVAGRGSAIARSVGRSTVHGHIHSDAGISYTNSFEKELWGMNVGCAMDTQTVNARYASKSISRAWIGWGSVTEGIPSLWPWTAMKKLSQKIN